MIIEEVKPSVKCWTVGELVAALAGIPEYVEVRVSPEETPITVRHDRNKDDHEEEWVLITDEDPWRD